MKDNDFSGITIYNGIDVHLNQWNVAVYVENKRFKVFQQVPDPEQLHRYLVNNFPNGTYKSVYEAGYFGYEAHRKLEELGIKNIVVNASDVRTSDKEKRRKSDKVDAKKLAENLVRDELHAIYVPTREQEADRRLVRRRISVSRKELTRSKQRVRSFLITKGIRYKDLESKGRWTKKFVVEIVNLEFEHESDKFVRDQLLSNYHHVNEAQKQIDRQIVKLSREEKYKEMVEILRSIPGIGLLTAMVLITEIIDMNRFSNLSKLCSYLGIVPDVSSSDKTMKVSGITVRANKEVRRILMQASWVASARAISVMHCYHRWTKKDKLLPQKAVIKVARKLLSIVRSMWLNKQKYNCMAA